MFLLVYSCRNDPESVWNRGVTVKEMLLVADCMATSLLVSPPLNPAMKDSGVAETVADEVPQMMGAPALIWARVSIMTQTLKIGLVLIHTLMVTVISDPEGIVENPEICTLQLSTSLYWRVLELIVEVLAKTVPCWMRAASLLSCSTKEGSKLRGRRMVTVMYCTVWRQYSMGAEGDIPSAVRMVTVGVQLTVWQGTLSSLTSRGVMELQGRLQMDTAPEEISRGLQMLLICRLNCLPATNCSLKMTWMMLGLITVMERIWGGEPVTAMEVTREETVKVKSAEMVKRKVERGVGTGTLMLKERRRLERVRPGVLPFCALMDTTFIRLLFRSSKNNCPMFQFYSCITPEPLITYIQKLSERAPIDGRLLLRMIWSEQLVPARSVPLKLVTTVRVDWMLGLRLLTAVVLMVSGLGVVADAVLRLRHAEEVMTLLRRVQVKGVMVEGKMGKTIIRQELVSIGFVKEKLKMKLDGEDSVLGEAMMGAVGIKHVPIDRSRNSRRAFAV